MDLLRREHLRQRADVLQRHFRERLPGSLAGPRVEELDPGERDPKRPVSKLLFVLEVEEKAPQLILADLVRRRLAVLGQLSDSAEVFDVRRFTHSAELRVIRHAGVELASKERGLRHREISLLKQKKGQQGKDACARRIG